MKNNVLIPVYNISEFTKKEADAIEGFTIGRKTGSMVESMAGKQVLEAVSLTPSTPLSSI